MFFCSLYFGLRLYALELFALRLGVGVTYILCLSNRKNVVKDNYFIYLVLPEPLAFRGLRFIPHDLRCNFTILISTLPFSGFTCFEMLSFTLS
jgi:hypothetical protein